MKHESNLKSYQKSGRISEKEKANSGEREGNRMEGINFLFHGLGLHRFKFLFIIMEENQKISRRGGGFLMFFVGSQLKIFSFKKIWVF